MTSVLPFGRHKPINIVADMCAHECTEYVTAGSYEEGTSATI